MYRILLARSGFYYVQRFIGGWTKGWTRVSPFYGSKTECRAFVRREKGSIRDFRGTQVVEYC